MGRRRNVINLIKTKIATINGGVSLEDSSYTYHTNLSNNVFRGFKYIDQINDWPCVFITAGIEEYIYHTAGNTQNTLEIKLRCFVRREDNRDAVDDLIEDIEHIIYKMRTDIYDIMKIRIKLVDTDQGLIEDYGIAEITVEVDYEASVI